jgi:hypothetical protein
VLEKRFSMKLEGCCLGLPWAPLGNSWARRVAATRKQPIAEVVEWASGGAFKYGDVGRMTKADVPKLRAATEFMSSAVGRTAR